MSNLIEISPEYVYITIPAEYICVYHRILAMLADYGEDMLKDCKASCSDRSSGVIECFNMFNAAVAARKLGKTKLAETLIKYIKAKINLIYKGANNSTSFVFPVDENGEIKAFVSCEENNVRFEIDEKDMTLYEHKVGKGFPSHFRLGVEDATGLMPDYSTRMPDMYTDHLTIEFTPSYEVLNGNEVPCAELIVKYNNVELDNNVYSKHYYFDDMPVSDFTKIDNLSEGMHNFKVVVLYKGETKLVSKDLNYVRTN